MPRKEIDYSKALIYKLCCLDPNVKELYVGSTTNIIKRRYTHKCRCNNPNDPKYNLKVYQHIRKHGGWCNWKMVLVEYFPCETELELGKNEDHWKQELQASLNSYTPPMYGTQQEWYGSHRERLLEYAKEYRGNNKEPIAEYQKEYYEANKERIQKKWSEKHTCNCGGKYTHSNKSIHFQTKKHQKHLAENKDK